MRSWKQGIGGEIWKVLARLGEDWRFALEREGEDRLDEDLAR